MSGAKASRPWLVPLLVLMAAVVLGARVWLAFRYNLHSVNEEPAGDSVLLLLSFCSYLVVGLVLLARRPDHPLGWVLSAVGLLTLAGTLAEAYAMLALAINPEARMPGAVLAAWIHNWYWYPLLALMFLFVPLLFPTGQPLTPRWRWLHHVSLVMLAVITVVAWLKPTLTDGSPEKARWSVDNPIGLPVVGDVEQTAHGTVIFLILLGLMVCAMVSLVLRFRRSRGLERQQMKLFVFAGLLMVGLPLAEELGLNRLVPESNVLFAVAVSLPPISIGVAVLRYRLYDIDRIISRTLTYALLTAVLLMLYLGAVTALTAATAPVTGDSPIAVAAATLLAAAGFQPARRRIQTFVDRRFNRARYDATRMVSDYRSALRDELDLSAIVNQMRSTADAAVQPTRSLVWLRPKETS